MVLLNSTMTRLSFALLLLLPCFLLVAPESTGSLHREADENLLQVLQNVLEKLQRQSMTSLDRRNSRLPICDVGASCLLRKGQRFGQLCECSRGSKCIFFFLKCL